MSLAGQLIKWATERPNQTALICEGRQITFAQLDKAVNRVANGLRILGIHKGDHVAIMLPNIPEFVYAFYACAKLGAVAIPFNTMYKGNEIAHILRDSGAKAIFCLTNSVPLINELHPDLPDLRHVITTGERTLTLADPDATVFVQAVVDQKNFADLDDAFKKIGESLVSAFVELGVADAWYKHRGSVRVGGKKIAGCLISEVENLYIINALCFVGPLKPNDFFAALWVPPEVKDKALEPVTSVEEHAGKKYSFEQIRHAIVQSIEERFGVVVKPGELTREERFGYQKQKSVLEKQGKKSAAPSGSLFGRLKGLFSKSK